MTLEHKEQVIAGTIRDQLERGRWTPEIVAALLRGYAATSALFDAVGDRDAEMYRRGVAMLEAVRDEGLDQQAFHERFIARREAA